MLHLTNGDALAGPLREAGLPGAIVAWKDVLHEGPVPAGLDHDELRIVRARFIEACGWASYEAADGMFAARDQALAAVGATEEVVLWFERDFYDQLQLVQILDRLGSRRASHVDVGEPREVGAVEPLALFESRAPVGTEAQELGRDAWQAFTSADPRDVERFLDADTADLPFLEAALARHLEEFPSVGDGLARTERQLLAAVEQGVASRMQLFVETTAPEERPYLGDTVFLLYLERLARGRVPLVTETDRAFELTEAGSSVLAGEADQIRLNGIDRWLGGVHLHGDEVAWRWDPAAGRLRPLQGSGTM